jgi:hypothetical protein
MILHDWNLEKKKRLIKPAYAALPKGDAFIAVETLIDDARRNAFGLATRSILAESISGQWCKEAGFDHSEALYLAGPCSAAIAYK